MINTIRLTMENIVPDVHAIAREMTSKTQIQMIASRFFALSVFGMINLILHNISFLPNLVKKDFATGIKLLCELEILQKKQKKNTVYALHSQMTDMAIALHNKRLLYNFFYLAKTYHFQPALITHNPEQLISFLSSIKYPSNLVVVASFNPKDHSPLISYIKNAPIQFSPMKGNI